MVVETASPEPAPLATHETAPARDGRADRWGWLAVGAMTAAVAVTWVPLFTAPFGDNHSGGITSRYALHLRNLQEKGFFESNYGADWEPYANAPYAHHPPLRNIFDVLFGSLPGDGEYQLRIAPFFFALLAIPAAAGLLRALGIRWLPTLLAVGLLVVTGYFWVYGHLRYDLGIILALAALVAYLRQRPQPPRWMVVAACLVALLAGLQSWPSIAFAGALGLWLLAGRRLDRVTVAVGVSMAAGVVVSLSYVFGVHGLEPLVSQTEMRTSGGTFTAFEFATRQWRFASEMLPFWYLVLLPLAVLAGLFDRRTRTFTAVTAVFAAGFVLVFNHGAYIHQYWGFLVLIPGLVGMGALLDGVAGGLSARWVTGSAAAAGLALMIGAGVAYGDISQRYHYQPTAAGRLVVANPPPPDQAYAWHLRLKHLPRWLAYYWDLPPRTARPDRLVAREAGPDDIVLVNTAQPPVWLAWPMDVDPVAQEGHYAIFRVSDILRNAQQE